MIEKIKKHRKDPIQKRTQNHNDKKKKKWGYLGLLFHPKISIFLYSSLNIEVMGKDNTFLRVIILAHQESGGFWWSEALLRRNLAVDCGNASLSQNWNDSQLLPFAFNTRRSWESFERLYLPILQGNILQKWRTISFCKSYGLLHFLQPCSQAPCSLLP